VSALAELAASVAGLRRRLDALSDRPGGVAPVERLRAEALLDAAEMAVLLAQALLDAGLTAEAESAFRQARWAVNDVVRTRREAPVLRTAEENFVLVRRILAA
jgi:hypothetical protein